MFQRFREPFALGLLLTLGFLIVVAWIVHPRWDKILGLELNALGDFLAGISSTLAFVWIIVAVLLQRAELEAQREELRQSREVLSAQAAELRRTADLQKIQTGIMDEQLKIAINERKFRDAEHYALRFCGELIEIAENVRMKKVATTSSPSTRLLAFDLPALRKAYEEKSVEAVCRHIAALVRADTKGLKSSLIVPEKAYRAVERLHSFCADVENAPDKIDSLSIFDTRIPRQVNLIVVRSQNLLTKLRMAPV
jgi:hypothetical protein